jgi:predicted Zn-dependent protease
VQREAPALFERSLEARPGSPRTWANLAEARYLVGDTSPAFEKALVTAARLGKAEPRAQRVVADYGLAVWDEVGAATRATVEGAVAAGVRRNPLEMLQIAERRGRLSVACQYVPGTLRQPDPRVLRLCPSRETAR